MVPAWSHCVYTDFVLTGQSNWLIEYCWGKKNKTKLEKKQTFAILGTSIGTTQRQSSYANNGSFFCHSAGFLSGESSSISGRYPQSLFQVNSRKFVVQSVFIYHSKVDASTFWPLLLDLTFFWCNKFYELKKYINMTVYLKVYRLEDVKCTIICKWRPKITGKGE